jgi:hypothetical protein
MNLWTLIEYENVGLFQLLSGVASPGVAKYLPYDILTKVILECKYLEVITPVKQLIWPPDHR